MGFFGMLPLIFGLFSGGQEALDLVDTPAYWQLKGVEVTAASMIEELGVAAPPAEAAEGGEAAAAAAAAPATPAIDYEALVRQLGAEAFADREAAQKQLEAAGEAAIAALEQGATSDDPEVSVRSRKAIEAIRKPADEWQQGRHGRDGPRPDGPQAKPLRRLMAIRTIGEMKYKEALPLLGKLTDSKVAFEAEYARRAIAAIEEKPYEPPAVDAKLLEADVAAMPVQTVALMQTRTRPGRLNLRDMLGMVGGMGMGGMLDVEEVIREATQEMVYAFEQVGNLRVDAVTASFGYSKGIDQDVLVLVSLRGQFDLAAIRELAKTEGKVIGKIADIEVLNIDGEFRLALISDKQLVAIIYDQDFQPPLAEMLTALRDGKAGGMEKNEPLTNLLKTVNQKRESWAALLMTKEMRALPVLAAIGSVTLEISSVEKGGVDILLKGRGEDDEQVAQAGRLAEAAYQGIVMQVNQLFQGPMAELPQRQAIMKALQGVRFKNEPGLVTVTGRLEDPLVIMQTLPMMWFMSMRNAADVMWEERMHNEPLEAQEAPQIQPWEAMPAVE